MTSAALVHRPSSFDQGLRRRSAASAFTAVLLAAAGLAGAWVLDGRRSVGPVALALPPTEPVLGFLLDPVPMMAGGASVALLPGGLVEVPAAVQMASRAVNPTAADAMPPVPPSRAAALVDAVPEPRPDELVPFPPPRPLDLRETAPSPSRLAVSAPPRGRAAPAAPPVDNRGFFEKLFGLNRPAADKPPPVMAYAQAEPVVAPRSFGWWSSGPTSAGNGTAVYDIAAHTVTLPNGTKLEAHSGLGQHLDDPGSVHIRMRGATPPHTYDLSLREKLFHGVRALRLTPVGSGHIYGRDGLLAHTYMLGPNGQSNGCVSFRDYQAFLQAFERGDVKRLVVVGRS